MTQKLRQHLSSDLKSNGSHCKRLKVTGSGYIIIITVSTGELFCHYTGITLTRNVQLIATNFTEKKNLNESIINSITEWDFVLLA